MKDILTEKGLFERLIRLETKMDMQMNSNKRSELKFTWIALLFVLLELINMGFNYLLYATK